MKKIKLTLLILLQCFFLIFETRSQEIKSFNKEEKPNLKKEIKNGNKFFEMLEYKQALYYYLRAEKLDSNNAKINFRIGICHMNLFYKTKALPYFEKASEIDPNFDKEMDFLLGEAYQLNSKWDQAIKSYQAFSVSLLGDEAKTRKPEIDKKINECKSGKELMKTPQKVRIENMGPQINSPFRDYAPNVSADESILLFTSRRPFKQKDSSSTVGYDNVFSASSKNGKWEKVKQLDETINKRDEFNSNIAISIDGQKMLVYKTDEKRNSEGDIYESTLNGDKWSTPVSLGSPINTESKESSASIAYDGKTIYFVSNRPGGIGGKDIYKCTLNDSGKWDKPLNLGKAINTPYDEEGVVIHPDGKTLYFSSKGHNSMGGYDIFKSTFQGGKWSKPENLGFPINSPDEDVFFVISASGIHGYYASLREDGYGETDIYRITWIDEEKKDSAQKSKTPQVTVLKGKITDEKDNAIAAEVEIIDNTTGKTVAKFKSNSSTGNYLLSLPSGKNYGITANKEGYLFHSENVNIPEATGYQEITKNISMSKIIVGSKIVLNNIFFETNKADLSQESTTELNRMVSLLKEHSEIRVEISGHTDNVGTVEYNQKLSEARAKSVVDYMIKGGITSNRMVYKGYGFSKPVATNDTDEGKQLNRRTEFEIIK